ERGAVGRAIEPIADQLLPPDGRGLADEHQKRGLEGVVGVVGIAEDAATHAQDHRPMPADQGRERALVPPRNEALQQLAVAQPAAIAQQKGLTQMLQHAIQLAGRHVALSLPGQHLSPLYTERNQGYAPIFLWQNLRTAS